MNSVILIGRLVKKPECKYGAESQTAVCRFSLAIDRGKDRNGKDMGADFPTIVCFGKTAENCERFLDKGRQVCVSGRIRTGSYEKDGQKVYTTDVYADRVEFLGGKEDSKNEKPHNNSNPKDGDQISGFALLDDDCIPF